MSKEATLKHTWARALFFAVNLTAYWGLIPLALTAVGVWIDHRVGIGPFPAAIGVPIGAVLISVGAIIAAWSAVTLYLRGGGFPIALMPPRRLVRAGPYGFSRHPLYLAFAIYFLGWAMTARSVVAVAIVPMVLLALSAYAAIHEERVLRRRFGEEYARYRDEVPFFFRYRHRVPGPGILFSISYLVGKVIVRLLFPTTVTGRANLPRSGPAILIANHACYLDPFFILGASGRYIRFLTKAGVMRSGVAKWFFTRTGSIPTDRYRVDPASVRGFLAALKAGEIVGVFPEGERTWDGRPLPVPAAVKRLLTRAGVPIIPVRIDGSYAVYPRWAVLPRPGPITITFFPPVGSDAVDTALARIVAVSDGHTWIPHSARGIELVLWACPICHTIGSIEPHGRTVRCAQCSTEWTLDRWLRLHRNGGNSTTIGELAAALPVERILGAREQLTSIGPVDILIGGKDLTPVTSGTMTYRDRALRIGDQEFPLEEARILRLEGKSKLDIGFKGDHRVRLNFHRDSALKWEQFLRLRLGIKP